MSQQLLKTWQPYLQLQHRFGAGCLGEQLKLHAPQSCVATHDDSLLCAELEDLEPEGENAKARRLWYKTLACLGVICPLAQGEDWPLPLWQTFFTTTLGFPLPLLSLWAIKSLRMPEIYY